MADAHPPDDKLHRIRHSLAHVMAQAVVEKFPQAKPTLGPPIEYGFYYDFDLDVNPTDGDLEWIANRMRQIIKGKHAFKVREVKALRARIVAPAQHRARTRAHAHVEDPRGDLRHGLVNATHRHRSGNRRIRRTGSELPHAVRSPAPECAVLLLARAAMAAAERDVRDAAAKRADPRLHRR